MCMKNRRTNEEIANTLTHLVGIIFALSTGWLLIVRSMDSSWEQLLGMSIFAVAVFLMYTASTVYHWAMPGKLKHFLRHIDHINIYVLIAASYTPVWLCVIGGLWGWVGFSAIWTVALAGAIGKVIALGKHPRLSLTVYLLMGWSAVFVAVPIWNAFSVQGLLWFAAEAVCYTVGTYFYAYGKTRPYYHAIWHLFVLGGTLSHFMVMLELIA